MPKAIEAVWKFESTWLIVLCVTTPWRVLQYRSARHIAGKSLVRLVIFPSILPQLCAFLRCHVVLLFSCETEFEVCLPNRCALLLQLLLVELSIRTRLISFESVGAPFLFQRQECFVGHFEMIPGVIQVDKFFARHSSD